MSIPLVQNNEKDSINTSLIAIKRQIERINMLLGLSNSEEIDTSVFATKDELQQAVTDLQPVDEVAIDNMHSVSSNAVAKALSYSTDEQFTGKYWIDGKKIYKKTIAYTLIQTEENMSFPIPNLAKKINLYGSLVLLNGVSFPVPYCFIERSMAFYEIYCYVESQVLHIIPFSSAGSYFGIGSVLEVTIEYTKTTD